MAERFLARVAVYLVLEQDGKILLSLRQNTGFADGFYSLVSGHVDEGEPATQAMIREAQEEIGIIIQPEDLTFVHVMYGTRKAEAITYTAFYFRCRRWQGNPLNCEPNKCGHVGFFDYDCLPNNMLQQVKQAISHIQQKSFFSEHGW